MKNLVSAENVVKLVVGGNLNASHTERKKWKLFGLFGRLWPPSSVPRAQPRSRPKIGLIPRRDLAEHVVPRIWWGPTARRRRPNRASFSGRHSPLEIASPEIRTSARALSLPLPFRFLPASRSRILVGEFGFRFAKQWCDDIFLRINLRLVVGCWLLVVGCWAFVRWYRSGLTLPGPFRPTYKMDSWMQDVVRTLSPRQNVPIA